ncbi:hypothetical protein MRX96_000931 [Rhipicephalus microplus]
MSIHVLINDVVTEVYPALDDDELPIIEDGLPIYYTADGMPVRIETVAVVAAPHGSPERQEGDAVPHHSPDRHMEEDPALHYSPEQQLDGAAPHGPLERRTEELWSEA